MGGRGGRVATRRGAALAIAVALAALILVTVGPHRADGRGLQTGLLDPLFTSPDPTIRAQWLDEAAGARAEIIRINVVWAFTVGSSRPSDPTNPADPAYDFGRIDAAVKEAQARGLKVLLTPLWAPEWAEGPNRQDVHPGAWKPNPKDLGDFAQALATRYSGAFGDLPRVRLFQAWTEPNHPYYLMPQWHGDKSPASPSHYRLMLNAFYAGVKRAQPQARVISAGTTSYGAPPRAALSMRPVAFLRRLFCLDSRRRPTKCPTIPRLDALAHHPITTSGGPRRSAIHPDDAAMPDFNRIRSVLRAAERAGHVRPRGRHPLWATEFWWITDPPSSLGVAPRTQARWIAEAFYLLWKQRVSVAINVQIRDDPYDPGQPAQTLQSGLFFFDGEPKPSARSFRFPFVAERLSPKRIVAWGKAPREGVVRIERKRGKGWRRMETVRVRVGEVFARRLRMRGTPQLRASIGGERSLIWRPRR